MLNTKQIPDDSTTTPSLSGEFTLLDPLVSKQDKGTNDNTSDSMNKRVTEHDDNTKGSDDEVNNTDSDDQSELEFEKASRGQVNGAAAVFGTVGFLIGGPILGIVAAAGCAHTAAKKEGTFANLTREWGGKLTDFARNQQKKNAIMDKDTVNSSTTNHKSLWDKITDKLVNGAAWVERRL
jgi:hypothetical protein